MKAERATRHATPVRGSLIGRESLPLPDRHADRVRLTAAQHFHRDGFAYRLTPKRREKIIGITYRLTTDCNQNIANQQAAFFGGTTFFEPQDQQTVLLLALESLARRLRDVDGLRTDAKISTFDRTMSCQCLRNLPGNPGRDR